MSADTVYCLLMPMPHKIAAISVCRPACTHAMARGLSTRVHGYAWNSEEHTSAMSLGSVLCERCGDLDAWSDPMSLMLRGGTHADA